MDMKILHMVVGTLILLVLLVRVVQFAMGKLHHNLRPTAFDKVLRIAPHFLYTLLLISGGYMLWHIFQAVHTVPYWIIAKIVLFFVAVSAGIKMMRTGASREQQKAGLVISSIAYIGIVLLVVMKPGQQLSVQNTATATLSTQQTLPTP